MFQTNETCEAMKECYLMSNIPERNLASGCHLLKILINLHGGLLDVQTYTSNRMHIIQILSAAPSFMGIWATRSPLKIHCYTCMSFKTCWSRLIYTKVSSHRSFVINMYVITMAWRCISPWSFHRSLQRRQEMDIFHICQQICAFWSKNNQKKEENLDWTLVNTQNLRV